MVVSDRETELSRFIRLFLSAVVGLDIQDENGRHEVGHIEDTEKTVLNDGKGCNFVSKFTINKVHSVRVKLLNQCWIVSS